MSRTRWLYYAAGAAMIGWGVYGLETHTSTTGLVHALRLMVLDVGGHDAVFAPVAFVLALLTQRLLPAWLRTPIRVGLAIGAVLILLALPEIRSPNKGRNSSILPLNYGRNLGVLLALVLVGVAVATVVNLVRHRRSVGTGRTPDALTRPVTKQQ
jgi:hypothetical protein